MSGNSAMVNCSKVLAGFRTRQEEMRALVDLAFPPDSRVWPIGVKTGNWGGTVMRLSGLDRRAMAADYVCVAWDNGNRYAVPCDDIERR